MSLIPARYNFAAFQPGSFYKKIDFEVDGEVYNLTGKHVTFWIKDEPEGETLLKIDSEDESENGSVDLGGVLGTIEIIINNEFISEATWANAIYELILYGDPRVDVIMRGGFKIVPF